MSAATLHSSTAAHAAAESLIIAGSPFSLEPMPDDEWTLTFKEELRNVLIFALLSIEPAAVAAR